jgi:hypothetical protein
MHVGRCLRVPSALLAGGRFGMPVDASVLFGIPLGRTLSLIEPASTRAQGHGALPAPVGLPLRACFPLRQCLRMSLTDPMAALVGGLRRLPSNAAPTALSWPTSYSSKAWAGGGPQGRMGGEEGADAF